MAYSPSSSNQWSNSWTTQHASQQQAQSLASQTASYNLNAYPPMPGGGMIPSSVQQQYQQNTHAPSIQPDVQSWSGADQTYDHPGPPRPAKEPFSSSGGQQLYSGAAYGQHYLQQQQQASGRYPCPVQPMQQSMQSIPPKSHSPGQMYPQYAAPPQQTYGQHQVSQLVGIGQQTHASASPSPQPSNIAPASQQWQVQPAQTSQFQAGYPAYQQLGQQLTQPEPVSPILSNLQVPSPDFSRQEPAQAKSSPDFSRQEPAQAEPFHVSQVDRTKQAHASMQMSSGGASALGIGGPSDWESFGHTHHEVDDLELYTKPRVREAPDTPVELPAYSPEEIRAEISNAASLRPHPHQSPVAGQQPAHASGRLDQALDQQHDEAYKSLQQEYSDAVSEVEHLKEREVQRRMFEDQLKKESQELNERISALQKECLAAHSAIANLEQTIEAMQASHASATNDKASWDAERASLLADKASSTTVIAGLEHSADLIGSQLQASESALSALTSDNEGLKEQLEKEQARTNDPAPGLHEWYKASLCRFRDMLFAEEAAELPADKMRKFQDWVNAEAQVRGVNIRFASAQIEPSSTSVAESHKSSILTHDALVLDADSERYSPGGRPIMDTRAADPGQLNMNIENNITTSSTKFESIPKSEPLFRPFRPCQADSASNPGKNASDQATTPAHSIERPRSLPDADRSAVASLPLTESALSSPLGLDKMAEMPDFRLKSISTPPLPVGSASSLSTWLRPHEETFLETPAGSNQHTDRSVPIDPNALPAPLKPMRPAPGSRSQSANALLDAPSAGKTSSSTPLDQLRSLLPSVQSSDLNTGHPKAIEINTQLVRFSNDFTFISQITGAWEADAALTRRQLDDQRARRQAEAEEESIHLFQSGEIGYNDIHALEEKNKLVEQKRQEEEIDQEWNSFLQDVFGVIYARLEKEVKELDDLRTAIEILSQDAVAGQRAAMSMDLNDYPPLLAVVQLLLQTNILIFDRESELNKAVLDRDRRYKIIITRALYRQGQIKKMKDQEISFEKLERRTQVQQRHRHFKNCHMLLKSIKSCQTRGCDENEDYAQHMLAAIALLPSFSEAEVEVRRVTDMLSNLAQDSLELMRLFERVEIILNDAEYEQEIAKEKAQKAEAPVLRDLLVQKAQLDRELQDDAQRREDGVRHKLSDWTKQVDTLRREGNPEKSLLPAASQEEDERKQRISLALEEAKRRNGDL